MDELFDGCTPVSDDGLTVLDTMIQSTVLDTLSLDLVAGVLVQDEAVTTVLVDVDIALTRDVGWFGGLDDL